MIGFLDLIGAVHNRRVHGRLDPWISVIGRAMCPNDWISVSVD